MTKLPNHKPFKFFESSFLVKGKNRSCIYDVQRNSYKFIPNILFYILKKFDGKTINNVKSSFNHKQNTFIDEYFNYLFKNEYIFFCELSEINSFKKIKRKFLSPDKISNAVIEYSNLIHSQFDLIIDQLIQLGCRNVQIISYENHPLLLYNELLAKTEYKALKSIEFILKYDSSYTEETMIEIAQKHAKVGAIIVHTAPYYKKLKRSSNTMRDVTFVTEAYKCGNKYRIKDDSYFCINLKLYMEAQFYNVYFNRKVAITGNGNIKNCITTDKSFGNIITHQIIDIVTREEFQELWTIKKDNILICKDCEFRYICSDNRIPSKSAGKYWEHTTECSYNPETLMWKV